MKYRKKPENNEEISYWESMTDLMSALILIVLLIFALVLLYIVRIPNVDYKDLEEGDSYVEDHDDGYDDSSEEYEDPDDDHDKDHDHDYEEDPDDGGGGGGDHEYDEEYEYEYPGITDDTGKTAVHVTVVDGETEKVIKKDEIEFQLFRQNNLLQVLCTYYPQRIEYSKFETTKEGVFYLPEKIPSGAYYFHDLTAPEGYDLAEDVGFIVEEVQDWPAPLEITIPMFPLRNIIRVRMTDRETGAPIPGAEFDVVAAEDIITFDGTLRFSKGQIADHIICDENGYGSSTELFLGEYELSETRVPEYYAKEVKNPEVTLSKKDSSKDREVTLPSGKTRMVLSVKDELDGVTPVPGAQFMVQAAGSAEKRTATTDTKGQLILTDLAKNTTYEIIQTSSGEGYLFDENTQTFTVSEEGLIDDRTEASIDIRNRKIRITVGIQDAVIRNLVSDYSAALYDEQGELVIRWDSSGIAETIEGITPGTYQLILKGDKEHPYLIQVEDTAQEQHFSVSVWTAGSIITIVVSVLAVILIIVLIIIRIKKKRRKGTK